MATRMPSRAAVIVNPVKVSNTAALRGVVSGVLARTEGAEPIWLETTRRDPGSGQTRAALARGADLVMAYGGDGTLRACAAALAGTGVPLALLPGGTGNLLARNLGIPADLRTAVEVAVGGDVRQIDVCRAAGESFVVMAGVGFDARMMQATSSVLKRELGWLAYGLAATRTIRAAPTMRIRLELADGRSWTTSGVGVLAANVGTLTGGITLLPQAVVDDGQLAVAVLTPHRLRDWAGLGGRLTSGRVPKPNQLRCWKTQSLRVSLDRPALVEVDGEVLDERAELDVTVSPRALSVRVPPA
jgi:YegS/Rv2252/BmrU family lipid kinase